MKRYLIVEGDPTSSGGVVIVGGPTLSTINGWSIAGVGDAATCPLHGGVFAIVTGDPTYIVNDKAAAREGDFLSCGCSLVSVKQRLQYRDDGDASGTATPDPVQATLSAVAQTTPASDSKTPVCEACLKKAMQAGTPLLGR
ncbi:PAAR domain-containing protein [Pseudomonas agarici]|uniref:PAAR domain-containing protein n=1 Tax=Pseudomonas agarici TaxID=46677 RepID=UPI000375567F|nr:PAAR domain-containing protein [Pseudomonas agarici]NWC10765.1 PAAR domain-containing protein [Pseudomonas agarici]SEL49022.1 Zn-binding Pro-Ala-Ala-Arg (PAAR) domain-containing protein, incolved in TypeVI secretion [Pseudomonas agarici]